MKTNNINDEEIASILVRCQHGERAAQALLYRKTASFLNYIAFTIVGSEALSNEVLQDSFIQILENAKHYDPQRGSALAWMRTILRNKAIDKLRMENKHHRLRYSESENPIDELHSPIDTQPDAAFEKLEFNRLIVEHIKRLPTNQRLSMTLAYFHGYSRIDLALSMGTNINTIKSWLRRGLKTIKNQQSADCSHFY